MNILKKPKDDVWPLLHYMQHASFMPVMLLGVGKFDPAFRMITIKAKCLFVNYSFED